MKEDFPTFEGINTFIAKHAAHVMLTLTNMYSETRPCTENPNSDLCLEVRAVGFVQRCFNLSHDVDSLFNIYREKQTKKHTSVFQIYVHIEMFYLIHGWLFLFTQWIEVRSKL